MSRYLRVFILVMVSCWVAQTSCNKESTGAGKISGAGGSLARFAIVGNYLYIVDRFNLDVYNITDPSKPEFKATAPVGFDVETIFPYNDKLFMGGSSGMYIFSITQPDKPVREASITHFRACDPVVTNDSVAYVTLSNGSACGGRKNALQVYDVKDVQHPKLLNETIMDSPGGLGIKQNALYVCQGDKGMLVFDLKNPTIPKPVKRLKDDIYTDVIPYGNVLITYIDKGVSFYDITDPLNPVLLSRVKG